MGGYAAFVWPAYAVAVAVLGGLAWHSWRPIGPARRARRARQRPQRQPGGADDAQAAAAGRARARHVRCSPRRPRWCWSRSTTISCSSTARAIWPESRSAPDRRIRIGGLVEPQSLSRVSRTGAGSISASPTARATSRSSMTACCRTCSARARASSPREGCAPDGVFAATQRARQARREIHAARSRRRAEKSRALAGRRRRAAAATRDPAERQPADSRRHPPNSLPARPVWVRSLPRRKFPLVWQRKSTPANPCEGIPLSPPRLPTKIVGTQGGGTPSIRSRRRRSASLSPPRTGPRALPPDRTGSARARGAVPPCERGSS